MFSQRLHHLITKPAKWGKTDPVNVGDSVLFLFTETLGSKPNQWKLGIIMAVSKINNVEIEYVINPSNWKVFPLSQHCSDAKEMSA